MPAKMFILEEYGTFLERFAEFLCQLAGKIGLGLFWLYK